MNRQKSGYRWVVFGVVMFTYFLVIGQRSAPGLITDQLMRDFGVSASVIGLTFSIQFFAYAGLQIPSGLLSDRFGPNRFLIAGALLAGLGTMIYSLAGSEYGLMLGRLLVGIGDSMIFVNLVLIFTQWFAAHEFVKLLGWTAILGSVGAIYASLPFSMWIAYAGWRIPFLVTGAVLVVMSLFLYGVLIWQPQKRFPPENSGPAAASKTRVSVWQTLLSLASSRQAWALFLCHFGLVGTFTGFIGSWGVPYAIEVFGMTRLEASRLMMYGLIGSLFAAPVVSWLASRTGMLKLVYTAVHGLVLMSWLSWFLSGTSPSYPLVVLFIVLTGVGLGASSLTFALLRPSFPADVVGVATGFANTGGFVSAILLPILFGNVLDLFPPEAASLGYHYAFAVPAAFSLAGVIGVLLVREAGRKPARHEARSGVSI
mgnify:FL=1